MKSPFPDNFINLIDTILNDCYDKPVSRVNYFTFLTWFETKLSYKKNEFNSVEIRNHVERKKWGRYKQQWKLQLILNSLIDKRIITSTGYLTGQHSKRYSYTEYFLKELDYSSFSIIYEEINEQIYNNFKNFKVSDENDPQYKLLMSDRFTIDVDKCNEWLIDNYKENKIDKIKVLINIRRVYDLFNKHIFCVTIDNGRVYSSFNSLKKELRSFCFIDNKHLENIDLKSSQPYLFISYLIKKYSDNKDVQNFYKIVTEDDVYIWISKMYCNLFKKSISRDESKILFYKFLFKKTNKGFTEVGKILQTCLPSLYKIIIYERKYLFDNGTHLANLLQIAEAKLFIPICNKFAFDGALSVHDSIYFKSDLNIKKNILNKLNLAFLAQGLTKFKLV